MNRTYSDGTTPPIHMIDDSNLQNKAGADDGHQHGMQNRSLSSPVRLRRRSVAVEAFSAATSTKSIDQQSRTGENHSGKIDDKQSSLSSDKQPPQKKLPGLVEAKHPPPVSLPAVVEIDPAQHQSSLSLFLQSPSKRRRSRTPSKNLSNLRTNMLNMRGLLKPQTSTSPPERGTPISEQEDLEYNVDCHGLASPQRMSRRNSMNHRRMPRRNSAASGMSEWDDAGLNVSFGDVGDVPYIQYFPPPDIGVNDEERQSYYHTVRLVALASDSLIAASREKVCLMNMFIERGVTV